MLPFPDDFLLIVFDVSTKSKFMGTTSGSSQVELHYVLDVPGHHMVCIQQTTIVVYFTI